MFTIIRVSGRSQRYTNCGLLVCRLSFTLGQCRLYLREKRLHCPDDYRLKRLHRFRYVVLSGGYQAGTISPSISRSVGHRLDWGAATWPAPEPGDLFLLKGEPRVELGDLLPQLGVGLLARPFLGDHDIGDRLEQRRVVPVESPAHEVLPLSRHPGAACAAGTVTVGAG